MRLQLVLGAEGHLHLSSIALVTGSSVTTQVWRDLGADATVYGEAVAAKGFTWTS